MPGPRFPKKKQPKRPESLAIEPDHPMTNGPPSSPCLRLPSPLTEDEARFYYCRLRAWPILVARTSTNPWVKPSDLDSSAERKRLDYPFGHPITNVWESKRNDIESILKSRSIDYIGIQLMSVNEGYNLWIETPPAIVGIIVKSESTSGDDGLRVALECKKCLEEAGITNVEVEVLERFFLTWAYDA